MKIFDAQPAGEAGGAQQHEVVRALRVHHDFVRIGASMRHEGRDPTV